MWDAESFTEPLRTGVRGGRAAEGAPVGDGAPHPALDVRGRHRSRGSPAARRADDGGAPRRSRSRPPARASCCSRTTASCRSRPTRPRGSRSSAATPSVGVPVGTGSSAVIAARRLRGRGARSAAPGSWAACATSTCCRRRRSQELRQAAARGARSSSTPGMSPAEAALLAAALGRRDRVRHPGRGRGLRPARPVAAVGPGRGDRGRRGGQPQHDRGARDRQPGRHAVARRRSARSSRRGTPARPAARRSPRSSPARSTRRAGCR